MKRSKQIAPAFTIVEITLVIGLLVGLAVLTLAAVNPMKDWRKGKDAGIVLQRVYAAQKTYLADHPNVDITNVTAADIIPYLSDGASAMPTVQGLNNHTLTPAYNRLPPVWLDGSATYDPSSTSVDGLWDVGS